MKRRFFHLAILLVFVLLGWPVFAEDGGDSQEAALLENRREQIHDLVMIRLNNALDLSPTQSEQISQVLRKYRLKKTQDRLRLQQLNQQLHEVSGSGSEARLQSLIQQISLSKNQLDQVDDRMFTEVKRYLSPRQQAQFLFVMDEFSREVQAVRRSAPPPGGGFVNTY